MTWIWWQRLALEARARVGRTGLLAILLATVAIALALSVLYPALRDLRAASSRLGKLEAQRAASASPVNAMPASAATSESSPAATPQAVLPTIAELPGVLSQIDQIANDEHLAIASATYRLTRASATRAQCYLMVFDVTGGYVPIRRFLQALLNQLPPVALERISFSQDASASGLVKASIQLAIFTRDGT